MRALMFGEWARAPARCQARGSAGVRLECARPVARDRPEPILRVTQLRRIHLPEPLAAHPHTADDARRLQHLEVFAHRLTGHTASLAQAHGGHRSTRAEAIHE